jgi:hypothetical protein
MPTAATAATVSAFLIGVKLPSRGPRCLTGHDDQRRGLNQCRVLLHQGIRVPLQQRVEEH